MLTLPIARIRREKPLAMQALTLAGGMPGAGFLGLNDAAPTSAQAGHRTIAYRR
jgi:hypothetical protein